MFLQMIAFMLLVLIIMVMLAVLDIRKQTGTANRELAEIRRLLRIQKEEQSRSNAEKARKEQ